MQPGRAGEKTTQLLRERTSAIGQWSHTLAALLTTPLEALWAFGAGVAAIEVGAVSPGVALFVARGALVHIDAALVAVTCPFPRTWKLWCGGGAEEPRSKRTDVVAGRAFSTYTAPCAQARVEWPAFQSGTNGNKF